MPELKAGLAERLPAPEWLEPGAGPAAGMRLAFRAYPAQRHRASVLVSHGFAEHRAGGTTSPWRSRRAEYRRSYSTTSITACPPAAPPMSRTTTC